MDKMEFGDKNSPIFKVPEGYFDTLTARILDAVQEEEIVFADRNKEVFTVPSNYFNDLSDQIMQQTAYSKAAESKPVRQWFSIVRTTAAAVIALLISTFGVVQIEKLNDKSIQSFSQNQLDVYAFDEDLLVDEYLKTIITPTQSPIEEYLIINADESLLLSEL